MIALNLGRLKYREPLTDPAITSLRLTGLSPDTYYRIHLSALTTQGIGEPIFLDMSTLKAESKHFFPDNHLRQIKYLNYLLLLIIFKYRVYAI